MNHNVQLGIPTLRYYFSSDWSSGIALGFTLGIFLIWTGRSGFGGVSPCTALLIWPYSLGRLAAAKFALRGQNTERFTTRDRDERGSGISAGISLKQGESSRRALHRPYPYRNWVSSLCTKKHIWQVRDQLRSVPDGWTRAATLVVDFVSASWAIKWEEVTA